ncbi:MAG: MaoC/PaaZ C-terminal domain-containing protein [Pseudomonadota bacterium]
MMTELERYLAGEAVNFGETELTAEAIIAFASDFDPQRFHLSETAARNTHFGGLCASGWHTCGIWMRAMVDWTKNHAPGAYCVSPGLKNLAWPKPAFFGQTLTAFSRVKTWRENEKRDRSKILKTENWVEDEEGDRVMSFEATLLFGP